ncbi:zinc finger protein with KRAB and SCAN domains 8 isoform X2 [Octodon degus]|uniref:Zinc finger protein with KRAB and SCAN domains 8 isoform X2 n=1 Tax=Octodon degus TaxID=10160 RepID=A0A6P6E6B0_OCTDE|nr:zinc finger protein with KRAB and SCAN domains 8 isoform X2 [Octodon degus]XP_023567864.1 zinc finger protein with KRAB and SCAN domains 8 isoform X2 [Octodon degus]
MAEESRKPSSPSSPQDQAPEEDLVIVKIEEDNGWEPESSLHENNSPGQELFRLRFRQLCYQETLGPREALIQLRALCHQWLRPDLNSKEQILELLVLEQFLTILPRELQTLVKEHQIENGEEVVTLLEDLERQIDILGRPVLARAPGHRVLWEEATHAEPAAEPPRAALQPVTAPCKSPGLQGPQERAVTASQSSTPFQKRSSGGQEVMAAPLNAGLQASGKTEDKPVSFIQERWLLDPLKKALSRDDRPENCRNVFSLGGETRNENKELATKQLVEIHIPMQTQNAIFLTALQHFASLVTLLTPLSH